MKRLALLAVVVFVALGIPAPTSAQKVYRIGMLETTAPSVNAANFNALKEALRELGYAEGRNVVIEYRSADGDSTRFAALAAELARTKPDVIVARTTVAVTTARKAAPTTPIVMVSGDPVGIGLVASLARPGGMVTGLTSLSAQLTAKRVQLLKEAFPMGLTAILLDVRQTADLATAFDAAARQRVDALVVAAGTVIQSNVPHIVALAAKHRLPAIYTIPEFVDAGGLMAYTISFPPLYRRAAVYVDKILKGANPAELPVEQATQFELLVNLKTAKTLGLTLPQSLLLRADRIVQ